jgi:hypothetical protein
VSAPAKRGVTVRKYLAVVFAALAVFVAVGASSTPALVKPRVFTLLEVEGPQQPLGDFDFNQAPVGGDRFIASNTLYRWTGKKGIRVGRDRVLFTFMTGFGANFSHRATLLFQAQAYLPDGTIFVEGYGSLAPDGPTKLELPVVGGTRIYANARGYVKVRDISGGRTLLEFHVTP